MRGTRAVALIALVLSAGCGRSLATLPTEGTFDFNRRKFATTVGSDYSFVVQHSCFCAPDARQPVRVTVRKGVVVQAVGLDTGADVTTQGFRTVVEFFDYAEHATAERRNGNIDEVRVSFDPQYGYPNDIWVDRSFEMADEEQGYTLRDVQPAR